MLLDFFIGDQVDLRRLEKNKFVKKCVPGNCLNGIVKRECTQGNRLKEIKL